MANLKISQLTAASNAQVSIPLPAGKVFKFPIDDIDATSNKYVDLLQLPRCFPVVIRNVGTIDFKIAATATITIPAGYRFYLDSVCWIADSVTGLAAQPIVSAGITGNNVKYVNGVQLTNLTQSRTRDLFSLLGIDGETTLTATVDTAATGTTVSGRVQWIGTLLPDTP